MVLLLGPIASALLGGLRPAVVASITAFIALDVLYVTPSFSLRIADPADLLTLVIFMLVAGLVSALVDRLARRTAEVTRERNEADALARLANSTAVLDSDALTRIVGELRSTLKLDAVAVLVASTGLSTDLSTGPSTDRWTVEASAGEALPKSPAEGSYSAELSDGAMLVVVGPTLAAGDRRLLSAFVSQVRLAQATLRLQEEATRAEALAESNDLRQAILSAVSHDLRAPLANIKAAATSLTTTDVQWSDDDVKLLAGTIDDEVDRLTTLVVNLLDMSRLQTGMLNIRKVPVDVSEVIYSSLAAVSGNACDVDVNASEQLPSVVSDPVLLERVLVNVIRNALDWSPADARVRVEAAQVEGRMDIMVIDQGGGIPIEDRPGVFEPFQRLGDGGNAAIKGIGLGLAVARGFCDAIDATVMVEDTPGGGTTVVIGLPLEPAPGRTGSSQDPCGHPS